MEPEANNGNGWERRIEQRMEAITQSVELLASMQVTAEKELAETRKNVDALIALVLSHEQRLKDVEGGSR